MDVNRCVGCQLCMFACSRKKGFGGFSKSAIMVRSVGGFERGFTVIVCRACPDPPCVKVCPTDALRPREGGGVLVDHAECIGCGNCVEACPVRAIFWDDEAQKPNVCVYCGECVQYCPHGVLALEEVSPW